MTTRRKVLIAAAVVVGLFVAAFLVLSIDESPPDIGPLAFTRLDVPDEENAITYFDLASAAVYSQLPPREADSNPLSGDPSVALNVPSLDDMLAGKQWDAAVARHVLENNVNTFALIEKGLACRQSAAEQLTLQNLAKMNFMNVLPLARLMSLRAEALARDGKTDEAIEQAMKLAEFGHKFVGARGCLISYMVGSAVKGMGTEKVRRLLVKDGLTADRLLPLIGRLASMGDEGPALADAFRAEYVFASTPITDPQAMAGLFAGPLGGAPGGNAYGLANADVWYVAMHVGYFYKPNKTARQHAEFYSGRLEDASKPLAEVHTPARPTGLLNTTPLGLIAPNGIGNLLVQITIPAIGGVHKLKSLNQTQTAATEVLVALRCFKLKTGRLPLKLDELVPEYMPAVPLDDFDGKPIRYSAEKKIVYSVGEDFKDGGGMTREEALKWWAANKPDEPLEEGQEPDPWQLPDTSWPIEF